MLKKRIKITSTTEKLSRRIGLLITHELIDKIKLEEQVNKEFGKPGSNRGYKASNYVTTMISMFHDGAIHLEDVKHLESDEYYQDLLRECKLPTSDAIGDWLRRQGDEGGEQKVHEVQRYMFEKILPDEEGGILDIDATIITSEKGDAEKSYKGIRGYQPMLGIIEENGLIVGSQFRQGNQSPQGGLWEFIQLCERNYGQRIKTVRSDSAGFNKDVIENCILESKYFSVTAKQTTGVLEAIKSIPEETWQRGKERDGLRAEWEVAETTYTFSSKKKMFRLAAKRVPLDNQGDLFAEYGYWIVATNLLMEDYDSNAVILFHQKRGSMEKAIGELKNQFGLDHLPCGQYGANALYFTTGVLAYNIMQIIKWISFPPEERRKSVRTLRYQLIHLAGKLIYHARYAILKVAAPIRNIILLRNAFLRLRYSPL